MLYDSTDVVFLKWQNYSNGEEINGCLRLRRDEGKNKVDVAIEKGDMNLSGDKYVLYLIVSESVSWS